MSDQKHPWNRGRSRLIKWKFLALCCATSMFSQYMPFASALSLGPVTFTDDTIGPYLDDDFEWDWNTYMPSSEEENMSIAADPVNPDQKVLHITYQAGEEGGGEGMAFNAPLNAKYEHLIFEYDVYFDPEFDWVKGGKLPGLCSYEDSPTGCIENSTFEGFSIRYMWRENGAFYVYVYNPEKVEECGDYYPALGTSTVYLKRGQWQHLKQEIYLGKANKQDGYVRVWIDGVLFYEITDIMLRTSSDVSINGAAIDSFFGGSDSSWAPKTPQHAYFDNFAIARPPAGN